MENRNWPGQLGQQSLANTALKTPFKLNKAKSPQNKKTRAAFSGSGLGGIS
jgi:hypothetical protein